MAFVISPHSLFLSLRIWYKKIEPWIINYVVTQSVITCVSLPFLIAWGLPISLASPVGNLLFVPFISAFLLLSSFFFMMSLVATPPQILISALDLIADLWHRILMMGSPSWLISIPCPSAWLLALYSGVLIYASIFHNWYRLFEHPRKILLCCAVYLLSLWGIGKLCASKAPTTLDQKLTIEVLPDGRLNLRDRGYFCQPGCPIKRVCYKLKSLLSTSYGLPEINCCTVEKITQKTCDGLRALCTIAQVQKIIIPKLDDTKRTKRFWGAWYALKRAATERGTRIWYQQKKS